MLFTRKNAAAPAPGKPRSIWGLLFKPQWSVGLAPLAESTRIFLHLLASVFALYGLLPKNYPGLRDPDARLSFAAIIGGAWGNVRLTRAGAPGAILFFTIVSVMAVSAVVAVVMLLSLLAGRAHAADAAACGGASMFAPCDAGNDLALGWMNFLFFSKDLPLTFSASMSQYTGIQQALITTLGFYSNAIMVIAAIILFYHLAAMVVETAHHGVPMGKRASQIWAPIRLVVAVGLLVPVNGGLNCGQYIVIYLVEAGSGLASQAWSQFVNAFALDSYVAPPPGVVVQDAENLVDIAACMEVFNYETQKAGIDAGGTAATFAPDLIQRVTTNDSSGTTVHFRPSNSKEDVCGSYSNSPQGSFAAGTLAATISAGVYAAQQNALNTAFTKADTDVKAAFGTGNSRYFVTDVGSQPNPPPYKDIIGDVAGTYQGTVSSGVGQAVQNAIAGNTTDNTNWTSMGWMGAGAYTNKVAHTQAEVEDAVRSSGAPTVIAPTYDGMDSSEDDIPSPEDHARAGIDALMSWAKTSRTQAPSLFTQGYGGVQGNAPTGGSTCVSPEAYWAAFKKPATGFSWFNLVDDLSVIADYVATRNCVWRPYNQALPGDGMGIQFSAGDAFTQMVRLGHANLNTAYDLLNLVVGTEIGGDAAAYGVGLGADAGLGALGAMMASKGGKLGTFFGGAISGTGQLVGPVAQAGVQLVGSVLTFFAIIFFGAGFVMAYYLPLLPFIIFFFNILTWVVMVLEAIVMMPLVALAHLNPEGEGLPGANARNAYFFILNIMLRPILMIFGLICALLVFITAIALLNVLYALAIPQATDVGDAHVMVSRMVFSIMYVVLAYISANNAFKIISTFSDHAMAWMGTQGAPKESMEGAAAHLGQSVAAISTIAGQQMFSNIQQGADKVGQGIAQGLKSIEDRMKQSGKDAALARKEFNQLDNALQHDHNRTYRDDNGEPLPDGQSRPIPTDPVWRALWGKLR